jgi:hypothetical protein
MATIDRFIADIVLGGVNSSDLGYGVEEVSVYWADDMVAGAILEYDSTNDYYTWVASTDVTGASAVLIDVESLEAHMDYDDLTAGTEYTMTVAKRGMTINVTELSLSDYSYDDDADTVTSAAEYFAAAGMNKITDKVFG